MSDYFLSDVHLRNDHADRGRRLVRFLRRLDPREDRLIIAGDLCDFWMGSRMSSEELARDEALAGLIRFQQSGGSLSILPGNHDRWLVPFYEQTLGATILTEPAVIESHGLKIHIVHGHLLGARRMWKAAMESREFFRTFGTLPDSAAKALDVILEARNRRGVADDEQRHLAVFRRYADRLEGVDLAVFGHVHRPIDEPGAPRLIVLGGWQKCTSFLKVDSAGADFHVELVEPVAAESEIDRTEPSHVSP